MRTFENKNALMHRQIFKSSNFQIPFNWRPEYNYLNAACMSCNEIPSVFNAIWFNSSLLPVK